MNTNTILTIGITLLIGGIGGYALNGAIEQSEHSGADGHEHMNHMNDRVITTDNGMLEGGGHMTGMIVSSEREFIVGMIPHHQEAVDTAKEVLARGGMTAEIRDLATNIIEAQEREIAMMKTWHEDWYGEPYEDSGEYMPMMRELSALSGADLDRTFLEDMILHHMGAIMMARSVEPYVEHDEIRDLTQAIVRSQSAEIQLMRSLLTSL